MNACELCDCHQSLGFKIQMAFQPIVNVVTKQVFSYEALVRGEHGEGAGIVLSKVDQDNKYTFDQQCRITAISSMAKFGIDNRVNINFLPNAIYDPEACIAKTLKVAAKTGFPHQNIIFEVTEQEKVASHDLLREIFTVYKAKGFKTAIDDFGEGFAGLNLLADFQPDFLKLDMQLVQGISESKAKQAILAGIKVSADTLGIQLIAEGIEELDDYLCLRDHGISLMQGYLLAKPSLGGLPSVNYVS